MKKTGLLFTSILVLAFAITAFAQEEEADWRNFEFTAHSGITLPTGSLKTWNDSLGAKTGLNFGGSGGLYFNEKFCLGAYFNYTQSPMNLYNLHYKQYDMGAYAKYAFVGESNFEPYVKLSAGLDFAKFATWVDPANNRLREVSYDGGLAFGAYAGFLFYTSDYGGIFAEAGYHLANLKDNPGEHAGKEYYFKDNLKYLDIKVGVMVFFGPEK